MIKKFYAFTLLGLVISVSVGIMIIPTYFTQSISRVTLNKEINLPLIMNDNKKIKLVFFGYSGCTDICTPRLQSLSKFYNTLDAPTKKKVGIEFVDISIPADTTLPNRFASFFHPDFKGIFLDNKILRLYTKEFHVYFSKSLLDTTQYNHSTNLYLIIKNNGHKTIRYIYTTYPYNYNQIKSDIEGVLNG